MAAPKGNSFWLLRAKHGRDKLFTSPELLWEAACDYFRSVDDNPMTSEDWVGGAGKKVTRKHKRPYTIAGFCLFVDTAVGWWNEFKRRDEAKEFSAVISAIEQTMYAQKFEGAVTGLFNANIISRDLGLADKREEKNETTVSGAVTVEIKNSGIKLAGKESDVDTTR